MFFGRILWKGSKRLFSTQKCTRMNLLPLSLRSGRQQSGPKTFKRYVGSSSSKNSSNKSLPIIIGVVAAGGVAAYGYSVFKKKPTDPAVEDFGAEVPFVNEHFSEDLELINNFGPVPYLLIGAGSAAFTAFRAIRTRDPTAKIIMVGNEAYFPYMRPPLSKEMWFDEKGDAAKTLSFTQWNGKERSLFYEPEDYYFSVKELLESKNGGISVIRGKRVVRIDPVEQNVYLEKGEKLSYEKCLIATGSKPKNLPIFESADESIKKHISLFRNIQDFRKLDAISNKAQSVVVVGGGFLGSELACGLAKKGSKTGMKVVQIFPESGNMGKILPEYLSKWTTEKMAEQGIKIIHGVSIKSVSKKSNQVELELNNGQTLLADHIVVAVGAEPNTEIAKPSGLEVDETQGGFLVNAEMEARKNLWIAGDASCFYDIKLGRRRVEHHDHAIVSGRLAGENMAGAGKPYLHQSMFWSDLGPEIGYEAIGIVDSSLPTVSVFAKATESDSPKAFVSATDEAIRSEADVMKQIDTVSKTKKVSNEYGKGVIFYLRDNVVVGILLWNVFAKMSVARKIISEAKSYDDFTEVAKLFELNSSE